eukprot:399678_1
MLLIFVVILLWYLVGCNGYINSTWDDSLSGTFECEEKMFTICPSECDTASFYDMKIAILDSKYMVNVWDSIGVNAYSTISNIHTGTVDVIGYLGDVDIRYQLRTRNVLLSNDNSKIIYVYMRAGSWSWILYHTIYAGSNNTMYSLGELIVEPTIITVPYALQHKFVWNGQNVWMTTDNTYAIILGNTTTFRTDDDNQYLLMIDISTSSLIGLDRINIRDGTIYTNDTNVNVGIGFCYLYDNVQEMKSRSYTDTFLLMYWSFLYGIDDCRHVRVVKYKQYQKISNTVKLHYFNCCNLNERYYHSLQCWHNPERHEIAVCASSISTSNKQGIRCFTVNDYTLEPVQSDIISMNDINAHYTQYISAQFHPIVYPKYQVICNALTQCGLINDRMQFIAVTQLSDSYARSLAPFILKISESSFLYILTDHHGNTSHFWNCSIDVYNQTISPSRQPTRNPTVTESTEFSYSTMTTTATYSTTDQTKSNELTNIPSNFEETDVSEFESVTTPPTPSPWIISLLVIGCLILIGIIVVILLQIKICKNQYAALDRNDHENGGTLAEQQGRTQIEVDEVENSQREDNETELIRVM